MSIEGRFDLGNIIEVKNLKKSYGDIQAVKGISFYVEAGKLFSFLGPNGAGKSTTIDILCTLLSYDQGEVIVNDCKIGIQDDDIRKNIGVVFQDSVMDSLLTVRENLSIRANFYFRHKQIITQAINDAAIATDVMSFIDRPYGKLSGGQRRRADIARALIHTPKILFLDEPTTGLDPQTRKSVWNMINNLKEKSGTTVFLTTHYMEEAASSDYVIIIDNGEIAAKGTPTELKSEYANDLLRLACKDEQAVLKILNAENYLFSQVADQIIVKLPTTMSAIPILEKCKSYINGFEVLRGTMDDAFISITGKEIRE